jgi:hypothetical protein
MTLAEALEKISKALAVLAYQTRAENLVGMYTKNKLVEDLLLPVFQVLFKAPHLRNLNQESINFPYIDLADEQSRLAVQVTTERTAAKVTETLIGFLAQDYQKRYDRLVFFILTADKVSHTTRTRTKWQNTCNGILHFDPGADIITILDLLPLIQGLPHDDIYAINDIIAKSVIGDAHVDVDSYLRRLSFRQLEDEKKSAKYIPDVFVETRDTKNLARSFCHPALFFHRTLDSLNRLDISGSNKILAKAGLPALPFPDLASHASVHNINEVDVAALSLSEQLSELTSVLAKYKALTWKGPPPFPVKTERKYYYEESIWTLEYSLGLALNRQVDDLVNELNAAHAKLFILTGRAGQGKTNLVCDLVENFLLKHDIPCAYLTGRLLRSYPTVDIGDTIRRLLFEGTVDSFAETARYLSDHADRVNKPVVLIIDGLNEHDRIGDFSDQLRRFLGEAVEYPNLKFFLTCRSEFFQQRFGGLTKGPFEREVFLWEANDRRMDQESYKKLVAGYFKFFGLQPDRVSNAAMESLSQDLLLLRFFCEAYGTRNKPREYKQPFIANIYRDDIFETYLQHKLGKAEGFFERITDQPTPTNQAPLLVSVLEHCVKHMLKTWQFSNVPLSAIPSSLSDALYVLLDEEVILRRDAPQSSSVFAASEDTINFTFDDFRDFLLAEYLLNIYRTDAAQFEEYIGRNNPEDSQIIEGLKKFLFYASRHTQNEGFWEFYQSQPWYADVYHDEIFNIDPRLHRDQDRALVVQALQAGGERAMTFSRRLAICWHRGSYPVLNLDLLLSFVAKASDEQYDNLIGIPFKTHPHFHDPASSSMFCKFITTSILPHLVPDTLGPETSLFRFLILLLPVDSGADLNSESFQVLRELLNQHPTYAITLLKDSLAYKPTRHRPYVWRLLALASTHLSPSDPLFGEAETEKQRSITSDNLLHQEVGRFLDRSRKSAKEDKV